MHFISQLNRSNCNDTMYLHLNVGNFTATICLFDYSDFLTSIKCVLIQKACISLFQKSVQNCNNRSEQTPVDIKTLIQGNLRNSILTYLYF